MNTIFTISTDDGQVTDHTVTEAEDTYLGQVTALDGFDSVVTDQRTITNGSGRVCGEHWTITAAAWADVQTAIRTDEAAGL